LPADDVYIDQPGPYTITVSASAQCLTFNLTGANVTWTGGTQNLSINGSVFTINSTTTWSGTGNIIFANTSVLCTATTNGVTLTNTQFQVNGAGGVILGSALNMSATSLINMQVGTLYINGFSCNVGSWSNSGTSVRGMDWGSNGSITLTNTTAAASVLVGASMTNFTLAGTGGFYSNANTTKTYSWGSTGGSAAVAVNLTLTGGGASLQSINATSWFNNLDVSGVSCAYNASGLTIIGTLTLSSSSAYTTSSFIVNATTTGTKIVQNGAASVFGLNVNIPGGTWTPNATISNIGTLTLVAGTLNASVYDLTCLSFVSNVANVRSVSFGSRNIYLASGTARSLDISVMGNWSWTGTGGFSIDMTLTMSILLGSTSGGSYTSGVAPNIYISGGTGLITMTSTSGLPSWVNNLDYGGHNGTSNSGFINIVNSLTGPANGNATTMRGTLYNFNNSNGGTQTIKCNGAAIGAITQNSSTNIVSLLDALIMTNSSTTGTYTLTAGTLKINGFSCQVPIFSSSNSNTRSIDFGTGGSITANHTTAGTSVIAMTNLTGFTWTGVGSSCGFYVPMTTTRTVGCGTGSTATTANAFNVYFNGGTSVPTITTGSWFNILDFTGATGTAATTLVNASYCVLSGAAANSLTLQMVGTGTVRFNGTTNLAAFYINCPGGTTTIVDAGYVAINTTVGVTITAGTLDLNGFTFTSGVFNSSNTNARGIKFTSGSTMALNYVNTSGATVLNVADATNFTTTGTGGFTVAAMSVIKTFTFGSSAGGSATNSPSLTFSTGASIPTLTSGSWFNLLDFGTTTSTIAATSLNLNGLTLSSGGTYTNLTPTFVGTGTFTPNSKALPSITVNTLGTLTINGSVILGAAATLTHTQGTIDINGGTISIGNYSSTLNNPRTLTSTASGGTMTVATSWTVTNPGTFTCTSANVTIRLGNSTVTFVFNGGGATYSNIALNNNNVYFITINDNNTINTLSAIAYPQTVNFQAGSTTTVTNIPFITAATGSPGAYMYSTTPGTQYTLSKTSGTVLANYLTVQDSNVTGGAYWDLTTTGTNTNVSNNTGWNALPASSVKGQFFSFF
jgi:hypothetical protein